jgi:DNA invertase Pin-like site-specific DNA recombinase
VRAAIYARVSTEEQVEGYSLDAQLRACREYATSKGWDIAGEYVDEGRSARVDDIAKRPAFARMMADGLAKSFDVVLVHKIDRFCRNSRVAYNSLDKLGQAGVGFVSLSENMDFSAPWGQFALTMLIGLAQLYSDNLSHETKKGKRERKLQGLYNGLLPFGVTKGEDGLPIVDPSTHSGLVLMFSLAAEGKSDREIATILNVRGYRTTGNHGDNPWRKDSVRRVLVNRFYLGYLPDGSGGWIKGKHLPLVDQATFDTAAERRADARTRAGGVCTALQVHTYNLTGLLRCAYCHDAGRAPATIKIQMVHEKPRCLCHNRVEGADCPQRSVELEVYGNQIGEWLRSIALPVSELVAEMEVGPTTSEDDNMVERRKLEGRLDRVKRLYLAEDLTDAEYQAEKNTIRQRLAEIAPKVVKQQQASNLVALLSGVETWWGGGTDPKTSNRLLGTLVRYILVRDGLVVGIEPRDGVRGLLPEWQASYSPCGSDGDRGPTGKTRYIVPHNNYPVTVLQQIARDAQAGSIIGAARQHHVSRWTVRRAVRVYG